MKIKTVFLISIMCGLCGVRAFAETEMYTPQNKVIIEGEAENGNITLMLVDKSVDDINSIPYDKIGYIAQGKSDGNYKFEFEFYKDISDYSVLIKKNGQIISDSVKKAETLLEAVEFNTVLNCDETISKMYVDIKNKFGLLSDDYKFILAEYDSNDALINVQFADAFSNERLEGSAGNKVKGFLWNVAAQLPVCESKSEKKIYKSVYVAVDGDDNAIGNVDNPVATPQKALELINDYMSENTTSDGVVQIILREGIYRLENGFSVENFGNDGTTLEIIGYEGEKVQLTNSEEIKASDFVKVSDESVLSRVSENARENLYSVDLKALGVTEYGNLENSVEGNEVRAFDVYFNQKPMTLGRYPNEGYITYNKDHNNDGDFLLGEYDGINGKVYGVKAPEDKAELWKNAEDMRLYGFFENGYSDTYQPVKTDEDGYVVLSRGGMGWSKYYISRVYYVYNLLEEVDMPGEYWLDRSTGILYMIPPQSLENAQIEFANNITAPIINIRKSHNIKVKNIEVYGNTGRGISVSGVNKGTQNSYSSNISVENCRSHSVSDRGITFNYWTVYDSEIVGCEVFDTGTGGIFVHSVDAVEYESFPEDNILIENNYVHHCNLYDKTYCDGIYVAGVGVKVRNNTVCDLPHIGIRYGGNNVVIENNNVYNCVQETNDAAALYSGGSWIGSAVIRNNFIHDCEGMGDRKQVYAVYSDLLGSGYEIYDNVFMNMPSAALFNGGIYNTFRNNLIINCGEAYSYSVLDVEKNSELFEKVRSGLENVLGNKAYNERYPYLQTILQDEPEKTTHVTVKDNILADSGNASINQNALNIESNEFVSPVTVDLRGYQLYSDGTLELANTGALSGMFDISFMKNVGAKKGNYVIPDLPKNFDNSHNFSKCD